MSKTRKVVVAGISGLVLLGSGLAVGASVDGWSGRDEANAISQNLETLDVLLDGKEETIQDLMAEKDVLVSERDVLVSEKEKAEKELDKLEDVTHEREDFQTDGNHALRIRFAREHYERKVSELEEVNTELEEVNAELTSAQDELAKGEDERRRIEIALDKMEKSTEGPDTNGNFVARINGINTRYNKLKKEKEDKEAELKAAEEDISNLKEKSESIVEKHTK